MSPSHTVCIKGLTKSVNFVKRLEFDMPGATAKAEVGIAQPQEQVGSSSASTAEDIAQSMGKVEAKAFRKLMGMEGKEREVAIMADACEVDLALGITTKGDRQVIGIRNIG